MTNCKLTIRILILFLGLVFTYSIIVNVLSPSEKTWPVFSIRTGEFSCDTHEECIKMAKEKAIREWDNQKELFDYINRWNDFAGFSILPLRYEISLVNLSYNQIETTGPMGEERQLPAKVVCGQKPFIEIWEKPTITIASNVEFGSIYEQMNIRLNEFDGCWWDISYANWVIKKSLEEDELIVGPNESVKLSQERVFIFPILLDRLSHIFIIIQLLILLPIFLVGLKPVIKVISKDKSFFTE